MNDFLQKLKKVVRIVLYGPAISQSDCGKGGPYQLSYNKICYQTVEFLTTGCQYSHSRVVHSDK